MDVNPATLSEYLEGKNEIEVLVEHGRCGERLGVHRVRRDHVLSGHPTIYRLPLRPRTQRRDTPGAVRGMPTNPRVEMSWSDFSGIEKWSARVFCACLPKGHIEKVGVAKLESLPVTFPDWKWGRRIDLPVVTI